MKILTKSVEMQKWSAQKRCDSRSIGFVPTMGALHEGHLALARRARNENDLFVASIFVNPTQFGASEDFGKYARPFARDCELLSACGCDALFAPEEAAMYPNRASLSTRLQSESNAQTPTAQTPSAQTWVEVSRLGEIWEGAIRPGHLRGVATIVTKLFGLTNPTRAYFGEKDFQQLKIIEHLVRDLFFSVEIVACETVRENDGLALSSRNAYLSEEERRIAPTLFRALQAGVGAAKNGERDVAQLGCVIEQVCASEPQIQIQYLAIVERETLEPLQTLSEKPARALIAAKIGTTRLIDNVAI